MPRVVPSDVMRIINRMYPRLGRGTDATPHVNSGDVPGLAALAHLVEAVPEELIVLEPGRYAGLTAAVAYLRAVADVFQGSRSPQAHHLLLRGFEENPIALIREVMEVCPAEAPAREQARLRVRPPSTPWPSLRCIPRLPISARQTECGDERAFAASPSAPPERR